MPHLVRRSALGAAVAVLLFACQATPDVPGTSGSAGLDRTDPPTAPSASADQTGSVLDQVAAAAWRHEPLPGTPEFSRAFDAACRAAVADAGELPLAVVDVRGGGRLTLVYGDAASDEAAVCRVDPDREAPAATGEALDVPASDIADDAIDVVQYETLDDAGESRTWLIGRVGRDAFEVIAGFDDETFVWGAKGGGWYAMWWAGSKPAANVVATERGNRVYAGVDLGPPTARGD